jgi:hypothetical protein
MWNAGYTQGGTRYTVTPEPWNARIEHNQSRSFGFQGSYSEVFQAPTAYVLSGIPIGDQSPPQPVVPDCRLDTSFVVTADWPSGDGTRGFVAEIYLTNVGVHPVNWRLSFDFDANITNMWNAGYTQEGHRYTVTPASWNTRIEPGQTLSFGFQGSYEGTLEAPSNIRCHGRPTDEDPGQPFPEVDPEQVAQRFAEAYAALSEDGKARVADGRLVWNGYDFSRPSTLFWPGRNRQEITPLAAQDPFECPLEKEGVDPAEVEDWGTFFLLASVAGTKDRPVNRASATFVLPPSTSISDMLHLLRD